MATVVKEIKDRDEFQQILDTNQGIIILKFGADWCGPCKSIGPLVHELVEKLPSPITVYDLDVDDNFEIYAYLKSKKMVSGIPAMLAYYRENKTFASDDSISGSNKDECKQFFMRCLAKTVTYK